MTTQSQSNPNKPTHRLYRVEGEGKSARWIEIGAAWPNKDGEGYSIDCAAMPIHGRLIMRKITERLSAKEAA
jgi:hypothetical protein